MKITTTGIAVTTITVAAVAALTIGSPPAKRGFMELQGDPLHADTITYVQPVDNINLAKILSKATKVKPIMQDGTNHWGYQVTTWEVTLENGNKLRLELQGVLTFPEGTVTIEEARARYNGIR